MRDVGDICSPGGPITGFLVFPRLPSGLVLNPRTGTLTGTPINPTKTKTYLVEATNAYGKAVVRDIGFFFALKAGFVPKTQLQITIFGHTAVPTPVRKETNGFDTLNEKK